MDYKDIIRLAGEAAEFAYRPIVPNRKVEIESALYDRIRDVVDIAILRKITMKEGLLDEYGAVMISDENEKRVVNENADDLNRGSYGTDSVYHTSKSKEVEDEENRAYEEAADDMDADFKSEPTKNVRFTKDFLRLPATYTYQLLNQMNFVPVPEEKRKALNDLERMLRICIEDPTFYERNEASIKQTAGLTGFNHGGLLDKAAQGKLSAAEIDTSFSRYASILQDRYDIPAERNPKTGNYTISLPALFNIGRCMMGMAVHHGIGAKDVFSLDTRTATNEAKLLHDTAMAIFASDPTTFFLGTACSFSEYLFPGTLNPDGKTLTGDGYTSNGSKKPPVYGEKGESVYLTDGGKEKRREMAEKLMTDIMDGIKADYDKGNDRYRVNRDTYDLLATNFDLACRIEAQDFEARRDEIMKEGREANARYNKLVGTFPEAGTELYVQESIADPAERFAVYLEDRNNTSREMQQPKENISKLAVKILRDMTTPEYSSILKIKEDKRTAEQKAKLDNAMKIRDFWGRLDSIGNIDSVSLSVSRYWNTREYLSKIDAAIEIGENLPAGVLEGMRAEREKAQAMLSDTRSLVTDLLKIPVYSIATDVLGTYATFFNADNSSRFQKGDRNSLARRAASELKELSAEVEKNMAGNPSYYESRGFSEKERLLASIVKLKSAIEKDMGYVKDIAPSVELHDAMANAAAKLAGDVSAASEIKNQMARLAFERAKSNFGSRGEALDLSSDRKAFGKILSDRRDSKILERPVRFDNGDIVLPTDLDIRAVMLNHYGINADAFNRHMDDCKARGVDEKSALDVFFKYNALKMGQRVDEINLTLNANRLLSETAVRVPGFGEFLQDSAQSDRDKAFFQSYMEGFKEPEHEYLPPEPGYKHTIMKTADGNKTVNPSSIPGLVTSAYTELNEEETVLSNLEETFAAYGGNLWLNDREAEYRASGDRMPFQAWVAKNDDGSELSAIYQQLYEAREKYKEDFPAASRTNEGNKEFRDWIDTKRAEYNMLVENRSYDRLREARRADAAILQEACSNRASLVGITGLKNPEYDTARNAVMNRVLKPFCEKYVMDPKEMGMLADYLADVLSNGDSKGSQSQHSRARMILEGLPYNFQGYFRGEGSVKELGLSSSPMEKYEQELDRRISKAQSVIRTLSGTSSMEERNKAEKDMEYLKVPENTASMVLDRKVPAERVLKYAFRDFDARETLLRNDIPASYALEVAKRKELSSKADIYLSETIQRLAKDNAIMQSKEKNHLEACIGACSKAPRQIEVLSKGKESNILDETKTVVQNARFENLLAKAAREAGGEKVMLPIKEETIKELSERLYGLKALRRRVNGTSMSGLTDGSGLAAASDRSVRTPGGNNSFEDIERKTVFSGYYFPTKVYEIPPLRIVGASGLENSDLREMFSAKKVGGHRFEPSTMDYLSFEKSGNDVIVKFDTGKLVSEGKDLNEIKAPASLSDASDRAYATSEIKKLNDVVRSMEDIRNASLFYKGAERFPVVHGMQSALDSFNPYEAVNRDATTKAMAQTRV